MLVSALLLTSVVDVWSQDSSNRSPQSAATLTNPDARRAHSYQPAEQDGDPARASIRTMFRHLAGDQRQFWSAPFQLRRPASFRSFVPFAGVTGVLLAADGAIEKRVSTSPQQRSESLSNYATFSLLTSAAGAYGFGRLTHNDHLQETGLLTGEAVLNDIIIVSALQRALGRERPNGGKGKGRFLRAGTSFPSQHSAIAWSVASIVAHEYPGPMTKLLAYGLASTVTITRVTGKDHFPSDVFVGSALGWYLGRQVYRARHDSGLDGASWGDVEPEEASEQSTRSPERMGSVYVPLDSWVYSAIERLAALGYIRTAFLGLKPWTRMECARLVEQSQEAMESIDSAEAGVAGLQSRLQQEFAPEFALFEGNRNRAARVESVYMRTVSLSGAPLTDSDHFGQTLAYDLGRPFRRGVNTQLGASLRTEIGPAAFFVRGELQHSPSAPALSDGVRAFIASADQVPAPPAAAFSPINRPRLLDAYIALNLREGWQLSFGKQSLSWAPGPGGSFLWSDNIEPIPMIRFTHSGTQLPGPLKVMGAVRVDSFIGRLEGHTYIRNPYVYGNKINFRPVPNLELGFGRSVTIGGKGGDPLNAKNFLLSFFGQTSSQLNSVPGDTNSSFDWTFYVPKTRNYLVFYGDWYADDDFVPFQNPPKNPYRPGIYLTRFPRLPKLDFHMEAASTESPGFANHGNLNYWNHEYRDGYTNNGNLIGNTVGRMGRSIQCWFNYWMSPSNFLQFTYKHNTVSSDFVPGGGAWQDYSVGHEITLPSGLYVKSRLQYEHISRYPLLFSGPRHNAAALIELGWLPHRMK